VYNMSYALVIYFIYNSYPALKDHLEGFGTLWGQMLSITTFTLTFFVNQAYALWKKCSQLSRRLQGRLHDIGMNLASHAARKTPTDPNEASTYTSSSRQILELMSRYIRLFNLLTYASFTRSHRPILTPRGMRRLVERGLMTAQEREVLVDAGIPATQRHSAILMWMIRLFLEARAAGHILGDSGFEQQTMEKFHVIRAQYGGIGDELQGRMPLAYAHIVQVLVDVILWMYPIMSFSTGMSPWLVIAGTGILTISYQGLFDLAKQFLDPYDNENYGKGEDPLCVDTLIAEVNAGSVRWMYGFEEMPFSAQRLQDGELYDYLLPVRGYSVDELAQMEEDKIKREKALEEERVREAERRRREELEAAEAAGAIKEEEDVTSDNIDEIESVADSNATTTPQISQNEPVSQAEGAASNATVSDSSEATVEEDADSRPVHKVTTLPNGQPFSFDPAKSSTSSPVVIPAIPRAVDAYLASLSRVEAEMPKVQSEEEDSNLVPGMANLLDEASPEGKEIRLRQMLADAELEEKENENDVETETLTSEEYVAKPDETETAPVESKRMETLEISKAKPGDGVDDQPRLDGISQLQEPLPGEPERLDGQDSSSMQDLGGETPSVVIKPDNAEIVGMQDSGGASELRGSPLDEMVGTEKKEPMSPEGDTPTDGSEDGPEFEALAVEAGGEKPEPVEQAPMTLETYNEEVSKIMTAVEEEMLETEAILMSKPGYDPLGWDYDDKQLAPMTNKTEEEQEEEEQDVVEDLVITDCLEVLGMDEVDDGSIGPSTALDKSPIERMSVSEKREMLAQAAVMFPIDGSDMGSPLTVVSGPFNVVEVSEKATSDNSDEEEGEGTTNSVHEEIMAQEISSERAEAEDPDLENEVDEAKPTDRIEPIIIESNGGEDDGFENTDHSVEEQSDDPTNGETLNTGEPTTEEASDRVNGGDEDATNGETEVEEAKPTDIIEPIIIDYDAIEGDDVETSDTDVEEGSNALPVQDEERKDVSPRDEEPKP
jgi:hypothetical protein